MMKVLKLKLAFLNLVIFGIQAMAHSDDTRSATGIVNALVSK